MTYKVEQAFKEKDITGSYGTLTVYKVKFEGEEGLAEMVQKPDTPAPKLGDMLNGMITEDPKWGKKFKKEGSGGGFGGGKNDPQTRKEIIRQNALTNAVNFVLGKAKIMAKEDKKVNGIAEAIKYMSGKQVIEVADYFRRFAEGNISVVTEREAEPEIQRGAVPAKDDSEVFPPEEPASGEKQEEIDYDSIPI